MIKKMAKKYTFILSDESINSYGFRVLTGGIDIENFQKNPVMLYNHDRWSMPIGKWENIRVENNKLLADAVFDKEDETAKQVQSKVEQGMLNACSIGFNVLNQSEEEVDLVAGQTRPTVTKATLKEVSIVPIPANSNAIKLHYSKEITLSVDTAGEKELDRFLGKLNNTKKKEMSDKHLEALLSLGRQKGLINDENENHYRKLASANYDATYELIEAHKVEEKKEEKLKDGEKLLTASDIVEEMKKLSENGQEPKNDTDSWTLKDWMEKDPEGLRELSEKDNKKYLQIIKK